MEDKINILDPFVQKLELYGSTSLNLWKLKLVQQLAILGSNLVLTASLMLVLTSFILMANIGAALWLGNILNNNYYGFFCIAAFYALVFLFIYLFLRNSIKNGAANAIVSQINN